MIPAGAALLVAALFASWAVAHATQSRATAQRLGQNVQRAHVASAALSRTAPRHMPSGGAQVLVERLEESLIAAGADKQSMRSVNLQSLGGLSDVHSARQQARLELTNLTTRQAAVAIDAIESCGLPVWVESMDLSATGEGADGWNATIQVNWIARAADSRTR